MPFSEINIDKIIEEECKDPEFKKHYIDIKKEYDFIWKIVKARKEKGLTQKALAEQIGVSQQEISRFERLRHVPNLSSLMKIIDAIGLELMLVNKAPEDDLLINRINDKCEESIYKATLEE